MASLLHFFLTSHQRHNGVARSGIRVVFAAKRVSDALRTGLDAAFGDASSHQGSTSSRPAITTASGASAGASAFLTAQTCRCEENEKAPINRQTAMEVSVPLAPLLLVLPPASVYS